MQFRAARLTYQRINPTYSSPITATLSSVRLWIREAAEISAPDLIRSDLTRQRKEGTETIIEQVGLLLSLDSNLLDIVQPDHLSEQCTAQHSRLWLLAAQSKDTTTASLEILSNGS